MQLSFARGFSLMSNYLRPTTQQSKMQYSVRIPSKDMQEQQPVIKKTLLQSGMSVITESPAFPGQVSLGLLYRFGSRDESLSSPGVLQALKNTCLTPYEQNTFIRLQLLGARFDMDFDHEYIYYSAQCLSEDVKSLLELMHSVVNSYKIEKSRDQELINARHEAFWDLRDEDSFDRTSKEMWVQRVFEGGLSNPLSGIKEKIPGVDDINAVSEKINSTAPILIASGVDSHEDFTQLARSIFTSTHKLAPQLSVSPSKFIAKEFRIQCENNESYAYLSFEGVHITSPKYVLLELVRHALQTEFHRPEASSRKNAAIYAKNLGGFNLGFADTGVFGIKLSVPTSFSSSMFDIIYRKLSEIISISSDELEKVKRNYKIEVVKDIENSQRRIENIARGYANANKQIFDIKNLFNNIDQINPEDLRKVFGELVKSKPNLMTISSNVGAIAGIEQITEALSSL